MVFQFGNFKTKSNLEPETNLDLFILKSQVAKNNKIQRHSLCSSGTKSWISSWKLRGFNQLGKGGPPGEELLIIILCCIWWLSRVPSFRVLFCSAFIVSVRLKKWDLKIAPSAESVRSPSPPVPEASFSPHAHLNLKKPPAWLSCGPQTTPPKPDSHLGKSAGAHVTSLPENATKPVC